MALPFFYIDNFNPSQTTIMLDEDTSKHVILVLRMKEGEQINLTDGKGNLLTTEIISDHKKRCEVSVKSVQHQQQSIRKVTIGISLIKNNSRFEWFLEKATEIGIYEIIPLICERTEKQKFRSDRMKSILVSAMLQSQQCWLPVLLEPVSFKKVIEDSEQQQKFIAHCIEDDKKELADAINKSLQTQIIVIGPEGDFTKEEIDFALNHQYTAVALGETRLRTETAGIVAGVVLQLS